MMYIFPSRLYPSRYALHAVTNATTSAVRRRTSCAARKYIPGTISAPKNAGRMRIARGVSPVEYVTSSPEAVFSPWAVPVARPSSQYNS